MSEITRSIPAAKDQPIADLPRSLAIATSIALCLFAIVGCSQNVETRGERVGVEGTVLLDGLPLQNARIMFIGDAGSGQLKAIGSVVDGTFVFDNSKGPIPGTNRIEIHPETMELEAFEAAREGDTSKKVNPKLVEIPAKYNTKSELTVEVKSDREQNKFEFELTSK